MFDVLVIGGGHAGCEAAAAAARRGARVGLVELPRRGHRPDVVQPVDRRGRQGPSGARARRVRRADGARRRPRGDPPPDAQPQQGPRGPGPARPGRPQALPAGDDRAARPRAASSSSSARRCACGSRRAGSTGVETVDGQPDRVPSGGHRHRHLPRRADLLRRGADRGRPHAASARRCALAGQVREIGLGAGPAQDRNSAAARRPDDRLGAARRRSRATATTGRCRRSTTASARPSSPARSPGPMSARMTSSARVSTARPCSPARSRGGGRAIARRSRTRCAASATATATRSSSSPRGWTTHLVYPNGISHLAAGRRPAGLRRQHRRARARRDRPARLCGRI